MEYPKSPEANEASQCINQQLIELLDMQLTPEVMADFSEVAVGGLVQVIDAAVTSYRKLAPNEAALAGAWYGNKGLEDIALGYHDAEGVSDVLDRFIEVSDRVDRLAKVVEQIPVRKAVFIPPDAPQRVVERGSGDFKVPETQPRVQSILFCLETYFGLNAEDPEQVRLDRGTNTLEMMRKESYISIEVHDLNRTVLVCDESGNRTFVFDTTSLKEQDISIEGLLGMTKDELKETIASKPGIGLHFKYSDDYLERCIAALQEDGLADRVSEDTQNAENTRVDLGSILAPIATDDVMSARSIGRALDIDRQTVEKAATQAMALDPRHFGQPSEHRFGSVTTHGYDLHQRWLILGELEKMGLLLPKAPEGVMNRSNIACELQLHDNTVQKAIDQAEIEQPELFGGTKRYRFSGNIATSGYNLHQRWLILGELEKMGMLAPDATSDIKSARNMTQELGIHSKTLQQAIDQATANDPGLFGKVENYRFAGTKSKVAPGYNLHQRLLILGELDQMGMLVPKAPDNVLSENAIRFQLNARSDTIRKAVEQAEKSEDFGEIERYHFGRRRALGYNLHQRLLILGELEKIGAWAPPAPDDVLSAAGIRVALGTHVQNSQIKRAIQQAQINNPETFGEAGNYRFSSNIITAGYNLHQRLLILDEFGKMGLLAPKATDDIQNARTMGLELGVEFYPLKQAINQAIARDPELFGNVEKYRFGEGRTGRITLGYNLHQRLLILQELIDGGYDISKLAK